MNRVRFYITDIIAITILFATWEIVIYYAVGFGSHDFLERFIPWTIMSFIHAVLWLFIAIDLRGRLFKSGSPAMIFYLGMFFPLVSLLVVPIWALWRREGE